MAQWAFVWVRAELMGELVGSEVAVGSTFKLNDTWLEKIVQTLFAPDWSNISHYAAFGFRFGFSQ